MPRCLIWEEQQEFWPLVQKLPALPTRAADGKTAFISFDAKTLVHGLTHEYVL